MVSDAEKMKDGVDATDALAPGSVICHGLYRIDSFLNSGGWGKVYLATDSLNKKVVVKECFPSAFCRREGMSVVPTSLENEAVFRAAVKNFVFEAQSNAHFNHPSIVGVHQVFEDCGTGYIAMEFVEGTELHSFIEAGHRLSADSFIKFMNRMLDCVEYLHSNKTLHRDISSDNIILRSPEEPVLIDFGAAKQLDSEREQNSSRMLLAKDGFSPIEFYDKSADQNAGSDIYALAATLYFTLTGTIPPSAKSRYDAVSERRSDPYKPLAGRLGEIDETVLASIDKALALHPNDRFASAADWRHAVSTKEKIVPIRDGVAIRAPQTKPATEPVRADEIDEPVSGQHQKPRSSTGLLSAVAGIAIAIGAGGGYLALHQPAAVAGSDADISVGGSVAAVAEPKTETTPGVQTAGLGVRPSLSDLPGGLTDVSEILTPAEMPPIDTAPAVPSIAVVKQNFDFSSTRIADGHGVEANAVSVSLPKQIHFAPVAEDADRQEVAPSVALPSELQSAQITQASWEKTIPFRAEMALAPNGSPVVRVKSVSEATDALQPGDVIIRVNGRKINNTGDLSATIDQARQRGAGQKRYNLQIVSSDLNGRAQQSIDLDYADKGRVVLASGLEMSVAFIDRAWQIVVSKPARNSDLEVGDVLGSANGQILASFSDLEKAIDEAVRQNDSDISLVVSRNGSDVPAVLALALH